MSDRNNPLQKSARTTNRLKAFACRWYTRFDRGQTGDALLPFLPESGMEFAYPNQTFTSAKDFAAFSTVAAKSIEQTGHDLGELQVRELDTGLYEVMCEHLYNALPKGTSTWTSTRIASRMKIQLDLKTSADPSGGLMKIAGYKVLVIPEKTPALPVSAARVGGLISANEAKAFVYDWFAHIDAEDAAGLTGMVASKDLDIDLFGTQFAQASAFVEFLMTQSSYQKWTTHEPVNIVVDTSNPTAPEVRFFIRFACELPDGTQFRVSNLTHWTLRLEGSQLKLQKYRLEML